MVWAEFLKIYTILVLYKIVPKDYDKYVEVAPGDNYIEQDPESSFLDKEFDPKENETYIPKANGVYNGVEFSYDNSKAYESIQNSQTLKICMMK